MCSVPIALALPERHILSRGAVVIGTAESLAGSFDLGSHMSMITEVVLFVGEWEHQPPRLHPGREAHVTPEHLAMTPRVPHDIADGQGFKRLTGPGSNWGGAKVPSGNVYGAAFNYLRWEPFKAWLEDLPWRFPEYVRVLVNGEGDRAFAIWCFFYQYMRDTPLGWLNVTQAIQVPDLDLIDVSPAKRQEFAEDYATRPTPKKLVLRRVFPFDGAQS